MTPPPTLSELLEHRAWLDAFTRRLTRGPDADDIAQDVWVRAMERPPRHGTSLRGWLASVARSTSIDRGRAETRRRRREQSHAEAASMAASPGPASSPEDAAGRREVHTLLARCLADVPEPYRATLWLHYGAGESIAAVATLHQTPHETVRTRLRRGRALLRGELTARLGAQDTTERKSRSAWFAGLGGIMGQKVALGAVACAVVALLVTLGTGFLQNTDAPDTGGETRPLAESEHTEAAPVETLQAAALTGRPGASAGPKDGAPRASGDSTPPPPQDAAGSATARTRHKVATLQGPGGEPIADSLVFAERVTESRDGRQTATISDLSSWKTDSEGRLKTEPIPANTAWMLKLRVPGYVGVSLRVAAGFTPPVLVLRESAPLHVHLETTDPRIRLEGRALMVSEVGSRAGIGLRPMRIDENGHGVVAELDPEKRYTLQWIATSSPVDPGGLAPAPLTDAAYTPRADPYVVPIEIGRGIRGRVTLDGKALLSTRVRIEALPEREGRPLGEERRYTTTDEEGAFAFEGLEQGTFTLLVRGRATGESHAPLRMDAVAAGSSEVLLELSRGLRIKGSVLDSEGELVTKGTVYVSVTGRGPSEPGGSTTFIQSDGTFTTLPVDPHARFNLYLTGIPGCASKHVRNLVPSTEVLHLRVQRAGSILGVVRDALGAPIPHLFVNARAVGGDVTPDERFGGTYANAQGKFRIDGLGDAEYELNAGGVNSAWSGTARKAASGTRDVILTVARGRPLEVKLLAADGQAPPSGALYASRPDGTQSWNAARTGEIGVYRFPGLPAMPLNFAFKTDTATHRLERQTPGTSRIEITLPGDE